MVPVPAIVPALRAPHAAKTIVATRSVTTVTTVTTTTTDDEDEFA